MSRGSFEMAIDRPADARPLTREKPAVFEELVRQYQKQVLRTALRLLDRREDAEDASQEVFLRLFKHLPRLEKTEDLRPWLYCVTVNVCHDVFRRRPRLRLVSIEEMENHPVVQAGSDERVERDEERVLLAEALKTLPTRERAAIVLRDVEGLTTREVAEALGTSEVTVRSHVCRGRVRIVKFLDRALGRKVT